MSSNDREAVVKPPSPQVDLSVIRKEIISALIDKREDFDIHPHTVDDVIRIRFHEGGRNQGSSFLADAFLGAVFGFGVGYMVSRK